MIFVNSLSTFYDQLHFMKNFFIVFLLLISCVVCNGQAPAVTIMHDAFQSADTTIPGLIQNLSVTIKDNGRGLLRWKSDTTTAESFFAVERSTNGTDFNTIGLTKNTGTGWFEFLDESLLKGKVWYRIKLTAGPISAYSEIVSAVLSADISCKFYPNPVDKVLIIRSDLGVEVLITDRFGKSWITEKLQAGLKVVDVSGLEPGIYVITLFQKETNRLITEKLVKK